MSKTDKTNPYWVKLQRGGEGAVKPLRPYHHHVPGRICDLTIFLPPSRRNGFLYCTLWNSYSDNGKMFGRVPDRKTRKALGFEGTNRMRLRKLRIQWKQEQIREDIDSTLHAPRSAKYVRDPWFWD